jgi:hypothetical protein
MGLKGIGEGWFVETGHATSLRRTHSKEELEQAKQIIEEWNNK